MKNSAAYTVWSFNIDAHLDGLEPRKVAWTTEDLADAVETVKMHRENGDGTFQYTIEHRDGSLVTRGDLRAAGIRC